MGQKNGKRYSAKFKFNVVLEVLTSEKADAEVGGYLPTRGNPDDIERSIGFFREALGISPRYARAHYGLGSAYLALSRVDEGEQALYRSLELDPDQWPPHLTLALRALNVEYDRAKAAHHFEATLARAPEQVVVLHTYAWYRAAEGDLDAALHYMDRALRVDPVSPRVHGDVGRLFYLAGRQEEAIAQCRRTLELTPGRLSSARMHRPRTRSERSPRGSEGGGRRSRPGRGRYTCPVGGHATRRPGLGPGQVLGVVGRADGGQGDPG